MPRSIPEPVSFPVNDIPVSATSDAAGNFVFATEPDYVSGSREYHFVKLDKGAATEVTRIDAASINNATTYSIPREVASQPAGFDLFRDATYQDLVFDVRAPDGSLLKTVSLAIPLTGGETAQSADYKVAPGGGVAVLRYVWSGNHSYTIRYGRFDANGETVVSDVPVDPNGGYLTAWGIDFAGNVLLLSRKGPPFTTVPSTARWLDPRGVPMTDWFPAGDLYIHNSFVAIPGGLGLRSEGSVLRVIADGQASAEPAPQWLSDRGAWWLEAIHGGSALAARPSDDASRFRGPCGLQVEVLAADGTSCGCVDVGVAYGIGRDGSAITSDTVAGKSVFKVYPGLFR